MKSHIPTPDQLEPLQKMKPLSSFVIMVSALLIAGVILAVMLIYWQS